MNSEFINKFLINNNKYNYIEKNDSIIIGLSGGVDSVGLFLLLCSLREEFNLSLYAIHINHLIRKESGKDVQLAKELCQRYNVEFIGYTFDIPSISKEEKKGLEEIARNYRKKAFEEAMKEKGANKIALAHHLSDQAETILFNIARGSAVKGLGGMKRNDGTYIRPLLEFTKEEIIEFVNDSNEDYIEDATNKDNTYSRNYLRNVTIPGIRENINNRFDEHIVKSGYEIIQMYNFVNKYIDEKVIDEFVTVNENEIIIDEMIVNRFPRIIASNVIMRALTTLAKSAKDISSQNINDVILLFDKTISRSVDLPYNMIATRIYSGIKIAFKDDTYACKESFYNVEDIVDIKVVNKNDLTLDEIKKDNKYTKYFNYDIMYEILQIRNAKNGDRIVIDNDNHTKKLSDYFIENKIPKDDRRDIPLLVCGEEIVWIIGYRISEKFKVTNDTKRVAIIKLKEKQNG